MIRLIIRIDIKNNYLVKGIHLEGLRTLGPVKFYTEHYSIENVDEIYISDSVASLFNRDSLINYIKTATSELSIPINVSGGVRKIQDINNLLCAGADKICINSEAIRNKKFLIDAVNEFGSSTISIGIDAKKNSQENYECFVDNSRESSGLNVVDWIKEVQDIGAGEIILTSIDKDGTRSGFDIELISSVEKYVDVPLIISGGAGKPQDFTDVLNDFKKVDGFAVGSIFHYNYLKQIKSKKFEVPHGMSADNINLDNMNTFSVFDVKNHLLKSNFNVRV